MKYQNEKVVDIQIAYIGGGSRGWARTFMTDLALEEKISGTIRLYDTDTGAAKANEIIGNQISARADAVGKWKYETAKSLEDVLTGADFVVLSILPATFDEMQSDVHLPERLGIYQSVGDTTGPGGMIRALRTIPMYVEIGNAIKEYSPRAWVINYTNPMSICVDTLYRVFPEIKAFGCCHEVLGTHKILMEMVEEKLNIKKVKRQDILVNVLGINHFTWFDYASYKGVDLFPLYRDFVNQYAKTGYVEKNDHRPSKSFSSANRVKFDLFKRFGYIAAAGDRHLAEFMPSNEYLQNPQKVEEWMFGLTTVQWRKEDQINKIKKSKRLISGQEQIDLSPSGEEGILLIKALCGLERVVSNVNIPNLNRQVSNLPKSAIVETNAVFERDCIRPLYAGSMAENIKALTMPHIKNQKSILQAAFENDKEAVAQAFLRDPLVYGHNIAESDIRKLVDDMILNTTSYLPGFHVA
jgi:alpha-galactosidase